MKKSHEIFTIISIIVFAIIVAVGVYIKDGVEMRNTHFFRLEINPKIEFMTGADNVVDSVYPVNAEAYSLVIGEDFVGLKIDEAVQKFLSPSAKMGYLDVDAKDNAVQISVTSSFTQALESKIYTTCNKYFSDNAIFCVIAESDADLALFNEAKKNGIGNIEKLVLCKSINEKDNSYTIDKLKKLSESDLLKIIKKYHSDYSEKLENFTQEELAIKQTIIANNKAKYDEHIASLNSKVLQKFSSEYAKYKRSETADYELDFAKKYEEHKRAKE